MNEEKDYTFLIGKAPLEAQKLMPHGIYLVLDSQDVRDKIAADGEKSNRLSVKVKDGKIDEIVGIG